MVIGSLIGGLALLALALLVWAAERAVAAERAEVAALFEDAPARGADPPRRARADRIAA